jgi:hypothetical protein
LPGWLNLSSGGVLSGTPGATDTGNDTFVVQATDGVTTATQSLTLVFSALYNISGQVSLANGGGPLPGVTISLGPNLSATTDSSGNFSLRAGNGTYSITPSFTPSSNPPQSSIFVPASSNITAANGALAITVNGSDLTGINLTALLGYTVSGNVSYVGRLPMSSLNRIFLRLQSTNCDNCPILGTSVSAPDPTSPFTIQGVPPGTYNLQAWMDFAGFGIQNVFDPLGASSAPVTIAISTGSISNVSVSVSDATATPVIPSDPAPQFNVSTITDHGTALAEGVIVEYQPITVSGVEQVQFYSLQWADNTDPAADCTSAPSGGLMFTGIQTVGDPITAGSGRIVILDEQNPGNPLNQLTLPFLPGIPYTFCMQAIAITPTGSAISSTWSTLNDPAIPVTTTPGPSSGSNAVSVNVTIPDSPGPLYVGCFDMSTRHVYAVSDEAPVNGTTLYTINGVPTGTQCFMFASMDNDNNGVITPANPTPQQISPAGPPDISTTGQNSNPILITGNTTISLDLTPFAVNSSAAVTTQHTQVIANGNTQSSYDLIFDILPLMNMPVKVTLLSGPNVISPTDFALCTTCGYKSEFNVPLSTYGARPQVGDTYVFQVSYDPRSQVPPDQLIVTVTGVSDAFVTGASPVGAAPSDTPTFSWTDPGNAGNYLYQFALWDSSGNVIWQIPAVDSILSGFSSSITSIQWSTTTDPTGASNPPSVTSLSSGSTYTWAVRSLDSNGNAAQTQVNIVVP